MAPQDIRAAWQALADRVWAAAALGALVELGVAERLSEPAGTEELAALAGVPAPLVEALLDVVAAAGLAERRADSGYHGAALASAAADPAFAADVRSSLLQSAELAHRTVAGDRDLLGWRYTDPVVLQAQGVSSAGAVAMLERVVFPAFEGLEERLRDGDGRFLDVGAGVAAVTVEMCRRYPALRAVAIEPQEAPLALARRNVDAAGLTDRIELRRQLVQDVADVEAFDVVWLPGNFLDRDTLEVALAVTHRALRPGGLALTATLAGDAEELGPATGRLRATLWGGDAVEPDELVALTRAAGFAEVRPMPRLASGLTPVLARR